MTRIALVAFALLATTAAHATQTVCTVTINSSNEKETFMRNLPQGDFRFVELTELGQGHDGVQREQSDWFDAACRSGVQCDMLVMSAHFGGFFFGSTRYKLRMPTLESNSCTNTCDGILHHPKEVYLFGCNTLAEKDKDSRTQQQYVDVLVKDGYPADMAVQTAETRYGAVGSTFKDQMRRIFAGVPHIYGFPSVSPLGAHVQPALDRYLKGIGDYSAHLRDMSQPGSVNTALAQSGVGMIQASGVGVQPNDAGVPYRKQICSLYDKTIPLAMKTQTVVKMLESEDRFIFLNSVVSFLNQFLTSIHGDYWSNDTFSKVVKNKPTMEAIDTLKAAPTTSLALRLDLMDLDVQLGRSTRADFETKAQSLLRPLIHDLSQANADTLCAAINNHGLKMSVTAGDFAPGALQKSSALYAMQCLRSEDPDVTAGLLELSNSPLVWRDGNNMRAYLLALSHLPGHGDERADLGRRVAVTGTGLSVFGYGLMAVAATGQDRWDALATLNKFDPNDSALVWQMYMSLPRSEALGEALVNALTHAQGEDLLVLQMRAAIAALPLDSGFWNNIAHELATLPPAKAGYLLGAILQQGAIPSPVVDFALSFSSHLTGYELYPAAVLAAAHLTPSQIETELSVAQADARSGLSALARWVLSQQPDLPAATRKAIRGPDFEADCEVSKGMLQCTGKQGWVK